MKLFIAASALIGLAASMPVSKQGDAALVARQPSPACRPNFQGIAVRIASELANNYVWTVPRDANVDSSVHADLPSHATPAAWLWQIDGTPANLYNARLFGAAANNLVLGQDISRRLDLDAVNNAGNNRSYDLLCAYCLPAGNWVSPGTTIGSGCAIVDVADTWYAQYMSDGSIQFRPPNRSSDQKWSFISV